MTEHGIEAHLLSDLMLLYARVRVAMLPTCLMGKIEETSVKMMDIFTSSIGCTPEFQKAWQKWKRYSEERWPGEAPHLQGPVAFFTSKGLEVKNDHHYDLWGNKIESPSPSDRWNAVMEKLAELYDLHSKANRIGADLGDLFTTVDELMAAYDGWLD